MSERKKERMGELQNEAKATATVAKIWILVHPSEEPFMFPLFLVSHGGSLHKIV